MSTYPKNVPTDPLSDVFINNNLATVVSISNLNVTELTDADSPYTVGPNDSILLVSAALGDVILNLPTVSPNAPILFIKRSDSNRGNWVYLNPAAGDTLYGSRIGISYPSGSPYPLKILDSYIVAPNQDTRWDLLPKEPFTALMCAARIEARE